MFGFKIPWQVFAAIGIALAIWGYGRLQYKAGADHVQDKWDLAVERGKLIVADLKLQQGTVTTITETVYKDRIKVIREKGETIVEQVPVFIPGGSDDLPGGFRLLHDAAVTSKVPHPSGIPNAAPVPLKVAATTIAENYQTCHENSLRLKELQTWVNGQKKVWEDLCEREDCTK